jgi:hypothetical protein
LASRLSTIAAKQKRTLSKTRQSSHVAIGTSGSVPRATLRKAKSASSTVTSVLMRAS